MTDDEPSDSGEPTEGVLGRSRLEEIEAGPVVAKALEHVRIPDREEFERHIESLSRLDHPHLAHYYGLRSDREPIEVLEEFIDGTTILDYVRQAPTVEEIRTLRHRFAEEEADSPRETDPAADEPEESSDETESVEPSDEPPAGGETTEPVRAEPSGDDSEAATESTSDSSELISETPVPESHTYTEAGLGGDETSDVILDPEREPDGDEARDVELIDVIFLRLERLVPQVIGALEYLHRFRQSHGALRPTNLLVDSGGRVKLADYGLLSSVELLQEPTGSDEGPTPPPDEALEYARGYLAPECRADFRPSPEADLYALGCILFEAITGCRPYDSSPQTDSGDGEEADEGEEARHISRELEAVEAERADAERDDSPPDAGEETPDPDRRYALPASALSELEPRCPAAWTDLILRLLDSDPSRRPDFDEIREVLASTRGRSVDIPPSFVPEEESFFGRDESFEQLVERAQSCVTDEELRVSLLTGAAGFGKTAMAQRLGQWAAQRGWVVLRGRCHNQETLIYQGWNEIAVQLAEICRRSMGELDEQTSELRRRAARLFPVLHPNGPTQAPLDRLAAVDAFRSLLRTIAAERPVLMILDDLNWANPDTRALLGDLIGVPEGLPCLVVSTWRAEPTAESGAELPEPLDSAPADVDRLEVRGFHPTEAAAYVDTIADLEEATRDRLLEVGESNPLLVQELVYQLHLNRSEADDGTQERTDVELLDDIAGADSDSGRSSGDKLIALIEHRLEELSRREMFIVQILSVVSLPLPESVISYVVDKEFHSGEGVGTSVRPLLDELRTHRLVQEVQSQRWNRAYTLFHDLTRQIVLDDIPVQHYTHLCDHLADGLGRLWSQAEELRFEFLLRAGRTAEAIDSAVRTARTAEDRFAYFRSGKLWRWLVEHEDDSARMTSIRPREELARLEHLAGHFDEAAELFATLAGGIPSDVTGSSLKCSEFEARLDGGDRTGALTALDEALQLYDDRYRRSSLLQKVSEWKNRAVAATQRWSDDPDEATHRRLGRTERLRLRLYRHVILKNDVLDSTRGERFRAKFSAIAERSRDALLLGYDRLFLARDYHYYGVSFGPSRADEWYEETEELFEIADDAHGLARMALGRARLHRNRGEFETASEWIATSEERLDEAEPVEERERYAIDFERALLAQERGELDAALDHARQLRHFFRGRALPTFRANQALLPVRLLRGEISRAEILIDECREFLGEGPACVGSVWLARQQTRMNLAMGRPDVAHGLLNVLHDELRSAGLVHHPYVSLVFHMSRAQALIAEVTRKDRLAEPRGNELFDRIRDDVDEIRNHSVNLAPPLRAETSRLFARFELLRDDVEAAFEYLEEATSQLASYPNPIARSLCAEAQGMTLQRDDPEHGTSLIEQSRVIYDHHGCHFPLVLEGWPVPERMAKLRPDPEE